MHASDAMLLNGLENRLYLDGFDFCLTFLATNLSSDCWDCLNRSATLSKGKKKVKSLLNGSQFKFAFDRTFTQLSYGFCFVLKKVGLCQNHLNTSPNYCSTFARGSFDTGRMNECRAKVETV